MIQTINSTGSLISMFHRRFFYFLQKLIILIFNPLLNSVHHFYQAAFKGNIFMCCFSTLNDNSLFCLHIWIIS